MFLHLAAALMEHFLEGVSIKATAKYKPSVYVLTEICLQWSKWLGPYSHVEAPKLYKRTADAGWNSPGSHYSPQPLMSPRLNENQDITEFALDKHYQRKINDLKRTTQI